MVTQPQILHLRRDADSVSVRLRVPADLHYLRGHFPGLPIVPGVVLLKWALELGRRELDLPEIFQRLSALKFTRILPLGREVDLELRVADGALAFEYLEAGVSCAQGRAHFA